MADPNAVLTAVTPRVAPAISASNNAQDRAAGIAAELTPTESAAATRARATATPDVLPAATAADPAPGAKVADATDPPGDVTTPSDTGGADGGADKGAAAPADGDADGAADGGEGDGGQGDPKTAKAAENPDEVEIEVDGKLVKVNLQPYAKREITKARNRQRNAEAEAAKARVAAEEAQKALTELAAKMPAPAEPEPPKAEPRPTREQFDSPDAYDDALTAWARRDGVREAEAKAAADKKAAEKEAADKVDAARRADADAQLAQLNANWTTRQAAAIEEHPDFIEVTQKAPAEGGPEITVAMAHAIMTIENGTEVAYYLGKNTAESLRIAQLPSLLAQGVEIGRLAAKLATPAPATAPARPRRPPPPIAPINGNNAPADTSDVEDDMETYAAKRTPQILAARQPFVRAH